MLSCMGVAKSAIMLAKTFIAAGSQQEDILTYLLTWFLPKVWDSIPWWWEAFRMVILHVAQWGRNEATSQVRNHSMHIFQTTKKWVGQVLIMPGSYMSSCMVYLKITPKQFFFKSCGFFPKTQLQIYFTSHSHVLAFPRWTFLCPHPHVWVTQILFFF